MFWQRLLFESLLFSFWDKHKSSLHRRWANSVPLMMVVKIRSKHTETVLADYLELAFIYIERNCTVKINIDCCEGVFSNSSLRCTAFLFLCTGDCACGRDSCCAAKGVTNSSLWSGVLRYAPLSVSSVGISRGSNECLWIDEPVRRDIVTMGSRDLMFMCISRL